VDTEGATAAREAWLAVVQLFTSEEITRAFLAAAAELELTPVGLRALFGLIPGEPQTMGTLATHWHCDASNVTGIVSQLEQRGLVARRADPADRRVRTVSLTETGVAARSRAHELMSKPPTAIAALCPEDQRALRDLLVRATASLPPIR
jgi:DNA-binding MarR family transcriptional regulator